MRAPTAIFALTLCTALVATWTQAEVARAEVARADAPQRFANAYRVAEDTGERVAPSYFLHRAWVQITRDLSRTEVPPAVPLELQALAQRPFAVAWLGHSAMLLRAGSKWVLLDPALSPTAGPVQGLGPARLSALPIALQDLPHIDLVLVSHDHYDHLDLDTVRRLARQRGGPPQFFVGRGLGPWFADNVGVPVQEFDWWQGRPFGELQLHFVPAQHNAGRALDDRNRRLWGGWVVEYGARRFYFAGDTAYVQQLFTDIRARFGPIDMAALPIGAYLPRALMRHEHLDPADAVQAFADLGARQAFGVHWGTFQLGDEEPYQAACDLAAALADSGLRGFGLLPIGAFADIGDDAAAAAVPPALQMLPARASQPWRAQQPPAPGPATVVAR